MRSTSCRGTSSLPATAYLDTLLAAARAAVRQRCRPDRRRDDAGGAAAGRRRRRAARAACRLVAATDGDDGRMVGRDQQPPTRRRRRPGSDTCAPRCAAVAAAAAASAALDAAARAPAPSRSRPTTSTPGFAAPRPRLRPRRSARCGGCGAAHGQALGEVELGRRRCGPRRAAWGMHPVLLDGCLQVMSAALRRRRRTTPLYLPVGIGRLTGLRPARAPTRCLSHAHAAVRTAARSRRADVARLRRATARWSPSSTTCNCSRCPPTRWRGWASAGSTTALDEVAWRAAPLAERIGTGAGRGAAGARSATGRGRPCGAAADLDAYDAFLPQLEALCARLRRARDARARLVTAARRASCQRAGAGRALSASRRATTACSPPARRSSPRGGCLTPRRRRASSCRAPWPAVEPDADARARCSRSVPAAARRARADAACRRASWPRRCAASASRLQLLFPGGSLDTAERLYRDSPTAQLLQRPDRRGGGGRRGRRPARDRCASSSSAPAPAAPRRTCCRALPVRRRIHVHRRRAAVRRAGARALRGRTPFMRFATLDLERDPARRASAAGASTS